jgi:peptidoglycan/xylan/chitin deacetylase (PgdA/CDA1 family)
MSRPSRATVSKLSGRLARRWAPHALPARSKQAVVSFSFDDFPRSAATAGASVLDEFGVKGTYFVSGSRMGRYVEGLDQFTQQDLIDIAEAGHEIGCHTFGHMRVPDVSRAEITDDIARNKDFICRILGDHTMSSFAYPHGQLSFSTKEFLRRYFPICRGAWPGINERRIDFMNLRAVLLEPSLDHAKVVSLLDRSKSGNGWVIFVGHDISEHPSRNGCTPTALRGIITAVLDRGMDVLPIKNAAARTRFA